MLSRRHLLGSLLVTAAAAGLPGRAAARPSPPVDPDGTIPGPLVARSGPGRLEPGFPVGHLAVSWVGAASGGGVRFRTAAGWGPWRPVTTGCTAGTDADGGPDPDRGTALLPAGGALAVELDPPAGADLSAVAINTTDGPRRAVTRRSVRTKLPPQVPDRVRYRSRGGWEADESLRFAADGTELFPTAFFDVRTFTVHHTVTANDDTSPAATVRAISVAHTLGQGFGDIGYHLLVDQQGAVYEGRWSASDPVPVFGLRGGRPLMSNGAHVAGCNAGNVGIALLGDLTSGGPTPAARETLVGLLAGLCVLTRVDPLGRVHYVNPLSGAERDVDAVAGHRDWAATECPGNAFAPALPDVRREVAALLRPAPTP